MRKLFYTIMALTFPLIADAQISLDASMTPPVNSMLIYYDANVPSPPFTYSKSGTNNTWDFSSIFAFPGEDDTVFYLAPSSIPGASAFPTSTHATYEGGDETVSFIKIDAGSYTYLGVLGDIVGTGTPTTMAANPPPVRMTFPYTYGSTGTSTTYLEIYTTGAAIGQPSIDSIHYRMTLSFDAEVIAAGNMILPSGTYSALLERNINTTVDSAWMKGAATANQWVMAIGFPMTTIDSSFYWYSDQSLEHYAHALYDDTGLHDVHYFKSQLTTGIKSIPNANPMVAYPNPVHDFLGIRGANLPATTQWTMNNLAGQQVLSGQSDLQRLNIQSLPEGNYILNIFTADGKSHQLRIIKN